MDLIVDDELQHECKAISLIDWGVVSARLQTRSANSCQRRYYERHQLSRRSPKAPFTPEEDLALLLAIQRLGTGGGVYGRGIGGENPGCIGTWSVIAAELPGGRRTAKECEQRHNELCEKFQPWNYTETRRLFKFSSRVSETANNETGFCTIPLSSLICWILLCKHCKNFLFSAFVSSYCCKHSSLLSWPSLIWHIGSIERLQSPRQCFKTAT